MKKLILILLLMPLVSCARTEDSLRRFNATCASLKTGIDRNQWNYRLQLLYQPEFIRVEPELHIEQSLDATASCKVIVSPGLWHDPVMDLFRRLEQMRPKEAEDSIYYDCGIEFLAPWNQKVVTIYFNKKLQTMKLNGSSFRMDATLAEWWDLNANPLFEILKSPRASESTRQP